MKDSLYSSKSFKMNICCCSYFCANKIKNCCPEWASVPQQQESLGGVRRARVWQSEVQARVTPCRARGELWPRTPIVNLLVTCWHLSWFLGRSVLVSVCCGGRPPRRACVGASLSCVWRTLPERRGLLFFPCSTLFFPVF